MSPARRLDLAFSALVLGAALVWFAPPDIEIDAGDGTGSHIVTDRPAGPVGIASAGTASQSFAAYSFCTTVPTNTVEYEEVSNRGKISAENLKVRR
jgi:hypothetical protein